MDEQNLMLGIAAVLKNWILPIVGGIAAIIGVGFAGATFYLAWQGFRQMRREHHSREGVRLKIIEDAGKGKIGHHSLKEIAAQLDNLNRQIPGLSGQVEALMEQDVEQDARLDIHSVKIDEHSGLLAKHGSTLEAISGSQAKMENLMNKLYDMTAEGKERLARLEGCLEEIQRGLHARK